MAMTLGRPISVRLPDDLRERIAALAKATRRSQGDVVREVLERDLAALEWEQRIADRARAHRAGTVTAVPASEVDQALGLEGVAPADDALDSIS
jgi:RHH-type rel operon transcriptional repressor/antitoxin RelB